MKKRRYVIDEIKEQILNRNASLVETIDKLNRYKRNYRREPDYNFAQYGNGIIALYDVRQLYSRAGYKVCNYSDYKLWQMYLYATGDAIDDILYKNGSLKLTLKDEKISI